MYLKWVMDFPFTYSMEIPPLVFYTEKVATKLKDQQVRLIMPTIVGLGFSSKISASQHTLDNHMRWIASVIEQLQLSELVFVGQDWGGPIGMGALALKPGLLQGAVILNTGLNAPTEAQNLSTPHALAKAPVLGELILEVLVSIFDMMPNTQNDPDSLPSEVLELYSRPLAESGNSKAPLTLMRMVPDGRIILAHPDARHEDYVASLNIPTEIVWGMNDPILTKVLPTMTANFPDAPLLPKPLEVIFCKRKFPLRLPLLLCAW